MMYSKKLKQHYEIDSKGSCKFSDGVEYSSSEMQKLMDCSDEGINAVHIIKKEFIGMVTE